MSNLTDILVFFTLSCSIGFVFVVIDLLICYALFRDKYERGLYTIPFFVTAIPVFVLSSFTYFVYCLTHWR